MYRSLTRITQTRSSKQISRCFSWSAPQRSLLRAALDQVPEHGWTQDAVAAAVSSRTISIATTGLVQAPYDLIAFCMDDWNDRLRRTLMERANTDERWNSLSLVDRLHFAFQTRLEFQKELIQANRWHEAIAVGARPENVYTTSEKLQEMVETVCSSSCEEDALGQLEKFSLGAIYVAAEMHMVSKESDSEEETWDFLHQQLVHWDMLRNTASPLAALPASAATVAYVSLTLAGSLTSGLASLLLPPQRPFPAK